MRILLWIVYKFTENDLGDESKVSIKEYYWTDSSYLPNVLPLHQAG